MASKPTKYRIKVMAMTDARTQSFYNPSFIVKILLQKEKKLGKLTQSVLRLVKPIERNVTRDN